MDFYNFLIGRFVEWMYGAIKESNQASIWKILVAYQKIVTSMEHVGQLEMARISFVVAKAAAVADPFVVVAEAAAAAVAAAAPIVVVVAESAVSAVAAPRCCC